MPAPMKKMPSKQGPAPKPTNNTSTSGRKPNNYDVFMAQRKKAGTKGY